MIDDTKRLFCQRQPWKLNIGVHMVVGDSIATSVTMEARGDKSTHMQTAPFLELDETESQELMDELWRCGVRPREGSGSAGSLAATQDHLKDMRELAFHKIIGNKS